MVNLRVLGARAEGPGRRATRVAFTGNIAQRVVDPGVQADTSAADAFLQLAESLSPLSRTMQGYADIKYKKLRQRSATEAQATMRELEDDQRDLAARGKWDELVKTNPELATLNPMARISLQRLAGQDIFRQYKQAIQEADATYINMAEEAYGNPELIVNARREALESADAAAAKITEGLGAYALAMFEAENARWRPAWEQALGKAIGQAESKAYSEKTARAMSLPDADLQALADGVHDVNGTSGRNELEMGHTMAISRFVDEANLLYTALLAKGDDATPAEWEAVVEAIEAELEGMEDAHARFESVAINGVTYASEERSPMDDVLDAKVQELNKTIALAKGRSDKVGSTADSRAKGLVAQFVYDGEKEADFPKLLEAVAAERGLSENEVRREVDEEIVAVRNAKQARENRERQERLDDLVDARIKREEEGFAAEAEKDDLASRYYRGEIDEAYLYNAARESGLIEFKDVEEIIADDRNARLRQYGIEFEYANFDYAHNDQVAAVNDWADAQLENVRLTADEKQQISDWRRNELRILHRNKSVIDRNIRNIAPGQNPEDWFESAAEGIKNSQESLIVERDRARDSYVGPMRAAFENERSQLGQTRSRNPFGGLPRPLSAQIQSEMYLVVDGELKRDDEAIETWGAMYDEIANKALGEWARKNPSANTADALSYMRQNVTYWQNQADKRFMAERPKKSEGTADFGLLERSAAAVSIRKSWKGYEESSVYVPSSSIDPRAEFSAPTQLTKDAIFRLADGLEPNSSGASAKDYARLRGRMEIGLVQYLQAAAHNSFEDSVTTTRFNGKPGVKINNDGSAVARMHEAMLVGYLRHRGLTTSEIEEGVVHLQDVAIKIPMHLISPENTLMYERAEIAKFVEDMERRNVIDVISDRWLQGDPVYLMSTEQRKAIVENQANRMMKYANAEQRKQIATALRKYFY